MAPRGEVEASRVCSARVLDPVNLGLRLGIRRMRRPNVLLLVAPLALLPAAALWSLWQLPLAPVRAFERIRLGMTPDEMESVARAAPGCHQGTLSTDRTRKYTRIRAS